MPIIVGGNCPIPFRIFDKKYRDIKMTEIELLIDLHVDAERQGPGIPSDTLKAVSFIHTEQNRSFKIADIGCGSGAQTIILAQHLEGEITAVDLFPEFLSKLDSKATSLGLQKKIVTLEKSMEDLPFNKEEYDIIWSEGAIYNIGFEAGIKNWSNFLKIGGYIAVSEITWTTISRPKEIEDHWNNEYPEIDIASTKIRILEENGFSPVGYFILPENCWIENFYSPMAKRFDDFLNRHGHSGIAKNIVEGEKEEMRLYQKYKDHLSYGFYIARKATDK